MQTTKYPFVIQDQGSKKFVAAFYNDSAIECIILTDLIESATVFSISYNESTVLNEVKSLVDKQSNFIGFSDCFVAVRVKITVDIH